MTRDYIALAAQYQADVLAGTIPACRWVRLAMERNRRDLDRQETEAFPYRFDPAKAIEICRFAEMLPFVSGKGFAELLGRDDLDRPIYKCFQLQPWQIWILATLFGWKNERDQRRFRIALILVPRKNGKSSLCAIIALYMLTQEGEPGAQVISAATTRDQAKMIAEVVWEMANRSPLFREFFGVKMGSRTSHTLTVPATASKFMPLSSDANSLDGLNISCGLVDEFQNHKTAAVWDVVDTATSARFQPLICGIGTAGENFGGVCHAKLGYLEKVLDGTAFDETLFGLNYTIDNSSHTDTIKGVVALEETERLCNCGRVQPIQIVQSLRAICAGRVTGVGIESQAHQDATSIQSERSRQGVCAAPVTNDGKSIETRSLKKYSESELPTEVGNGRVGTGQNATQHMLDTSQIQRPRKGSENREDSTRTGSRLLNTTGATPNRTEGVQSAIENPKVCTLITATARELFGDCCASDAIAQSVFSETLRNIYGAHSPTCNVRLKSSLRDDGWLDVHRAADDYRLRETAVKANPNYGVSVDPFDIERKVNLAQQSQDALDNLLVKHFNVWMRAESAWMSGTVWQTCAKQEWANLSATERYTAAIEAWKGYPCWIGVDLGEVRDPSALTLVFKLTADTYAVIVRIYWPEDGIAKAPTAQLAGWAREGFIIVTPGNEADYARIRSDLVQFFSQLDVQEIDFDRKSARLMMQDIRTALEPKLGRDRVEQVVLDIPQSVETMDPAMKTTEGLVLGTRIQHDGNPVMAWMVSNVVIERNHKGEIYPRKAGGKDSANKIDGPVSMFTAVSRAMIGPPPKPRFQVFFAGSGVKK